MKTAAAYIRVSDDRQDEYSPDSQLKLVRKYADDHGLDLPDEFIFYDDGISGKSTRKRDAFNEMIAVAKDKSHPIDVILVWKFSRFARNQEESIVYKSLLRKNNVDVVSISEPIIDGPFGSLIERIIEWMDEYYVIRLSGEVKRGMTEKVSRGEPICAPAFGYTIRDKQYFPDENAGIVRDVFDSFLAGEGMVTIARRLGAAGVVTKFGNPPDNRWIEYMLHNPVYIGKIRWCPNGRGASNRDYDNPDTIITDGHHQPIISLETWEAVQDKLTARKRMYAKHQKANRNPKWMLQGLVRCSACGSTLGYASTATPSMQCCSYSSGKCSVSHYITLAKAHDALLDALSRACRELDFNVIPRTESRVAAEQSDEIQKQLAAEKRRLTRAKEAYQTGVDTLEEYAENKKRIQLRIAELTQQSKHTEQTTFDPVAFALRVSEVIRLISNPGVDENLKNQALRTVIDHIIYRKQDKSFIVYFYS